MTKKFRKRISIKWILLPAVLAAAIVVPAAQADPWPFVQAENNATSTKVQSALEELGSAASSSGVKELGTAPLGKSVNHFLTGQVSTVPAAGVIADGLRYKALAQHYELLAGLNAYSQRYVALAKHYEQLAGIKADGARYTALAKKYAQPSTTQATGSGKSFQWSDAATGFGVGIGLIVLMSVVGFAVVGTRNRTAPA